VWLIVLPFLWFSRPTVTLLATGAVVVTIGLWIRAWAAGTIHKDEDLTTTGPYAYTRNPLYLGSLLIGLGVSTAGGHWIWPLTFLLFYFGVYSRTMAAEASHLAQLFPKGYAEYAESVPSFLPRVTPYRAAKISDDAAAGFRWTQYRRNREWEASLGAAAAFTLLVAKVVWPGNS
jgi:protein-S-isoprenylcysteine O-methyltransferase Ste14